MAGREGRNGRERRRGGSADATASVRFQVMVLLAVVAATTTAAVVVWRSAAEARARDLLEAQEADRARLFSQLVSLRGASVDALAKDYTYWDEMVDFVRTRDAAWADDHLLTCLATYDVDGVWVFDRDGAPIYGVLRGADAATPEAAAPTPCPSPFADILADFLGGPFAHGVVRTAEGPFEYRAARIHAGDDVLRQKEWHGTFVVGRRWDAGFLGNLSDLLEAEVSLSDHGRPPPAPDPERGVSTSSQALPGGATGSELRLDVVTRRPYVALMGQETRRAVAFVAVSATLILFAAFGALVRWVHLPLKRLSGALRARNDLPLERLFTDASEFGDVARLMRDFFAQQSLLLGEIAERRRVEAALEAARDDAQASTRAKGAFLANVSHEIRTPMNGVLGMTNVLASTSLTAEQRECVDVVRGSAESLLALLDDVLDLSKIEAGRMTTEEAPFDLRRVAEEVAGLVAGRAAERGVDLHVAFSADFPDRVRGDAVRVRQVLSNLLGNAVKFTERGEIRLEGSLGPKRDGRRTLVFEVRDTGVGIPADRLDAIFESFTQADDSTTRRFGGTGLGLTISRRLARLMGGDLVAESAPGRGSVFRATFVAAIEPSDAAARLAPPPHLSRALAVDPSPAGRRIAQSLLEELGFRAEAVADLDAAAAALRRGAAQGDAFGVTLADARLLEAAGGADAWRSAAPRPAPPVLALGALGDGAAPTGRDVVRLGRPLRRDALRRALSDALYLGAAS
ncbi:MAG TPA: ATP-binding protein [Planctomycetota bacterium]|nr:ATP-binding protein [Planctomycetota bacterium]